MQRMATILIVLLSIGTAAGQMTEAPTHEALAAEVAALRAENARLKARVAELEAQLATLAPAQPGKDKTIASAEALLQAIPPKFKPTADSIFALETAQLAAWLNEQFVGASVTIAGMFRDYDVLPDGSHQVYTMWMNRRDAPAVNWVIHVYSDVGEQKIAGRPRDATVHGVLRNCRVSKHDEGRGVFIKLFLDAATVEQKRR